MSPTVPHRHLWSPERLTALDLKTLLDTAVLIKQAGRRADGWSPLRGRHVALLCSGRSSDAALAFHRAVSELGGTAALLNADDWRARAGHRIPEAARLLGRLYDAIDCCDLPADVVEQIEAHSGVPVFNGLAETDHPMALLRELLTMREASGKSLEQIRLRIDDRPASAPQPGAEALVRSSGIHVDHRDALERRAGSAPANGSPDKPDFVLDLSASIAAGRLTVPEASAVEQARIAALLADNQRVAMQAQIVSVLG